MSVRSSSGRRANGEGCIYQRGKTYTAKHTTVRNGRCISHSKGGFKTKKEALEWLKTNTVIPTSSKRQTVGQTYIEWSTAHYPKISPKKESAYRAAWKNCAQREKETSTV